MKIVLTTITDFRYLCWFYTVTSIYCLIKHYNYFVGKHGPPGLRHFRFKLDYSGILGRYQQLR